VTVVGLPGGGPWTGLEREAAYGPGKVGQPVRGSVESQKLAVGAEAA